MARARLRSGIRRAPLALAPETDPAKLPPPHRSVTKLLIILGLLLGFFAERDLFFPLSQKLEPKSELAVTATIESGTQIELFVNGQFDRSFSAHIQPGVETTYVFHEVPSTITFIRLDLTDSGDTAAAVEKIELISKGSVVGSIEANALKSWQTNQLKSSTFDTASNEMKYITESNDPFIYSGGLNLAVPDDGKPVPFLDQVRNHLELLVAVLACILLCSTSIGLEVFLPVIVALLLTAYPVRALVTRAVHWKLGTPQIRSAVGNAGFHGYAKLPEQIGFTVGLAAIVCSGLLAALCYALFTRTPAERSETDAHNPFSLWKVLGVIALFMIFNFPQLSTARVDFLHTQLTDSGFDWANVFTWDYLYHYGFLPFRDYWFPYGGDYSQMGSAPTSLAWTYSVQCVLFSVLFLALYELCDRRVLVALAILLPAGILIHVNILQGTKRYFAGLGAVLGLLALWKSKPKGISPFVLYGVYLGWIFAREPNQLIYSGPALLLIGLFFLLEPHHTRRYRRRVFQLLVIGGGFAAAAAANCSLLLIRGQISGFFDFYAHMSAMGAAVSIPAALTDWYALSAKYENILLLSMHVLAGLGAFFLFRRDTRQFGLLLLGVALLESMIFFKMLLRPHMARQIVGLSVIAAGAYLAHWARLFKPTQLFAGAYLFGTSVGFFAHEGVLRDLVHEYNGRAENFIPNVEALLAGTDLSREDLDSYYRLQRFTGLDEDTVHLTEYALARKFPRFGGKFYVLGNESFLYTLLKEKPCPYISFYDGSNIWAQQSTVQCLAEHQPELIAWNSANKIFDDVPNEVRVPILFDHVIEHYIPDAAFGRFQVLRPRQTTDRFDWVFWLKELGETLNLGALPAYSAFGKLKSCKPETECFDFAELPGGSTGPLIIHAGEQKFTVQFDPLPADRTGYVNLTRIWFWTAAKREGLMPTFELADGVADLEQRRMKKGVLY